MFLLWGARSRLRWRSRNAEAFQGMSLLSFSKRSIIIDISHVGRRQRRLHRGLGCQRILTVELQRPVSGAEIKKIFFFLSRHVVKSHFIPLKDNIDTCKCWHWAKYSPSESKSRYCRIRFEGNTDFPNPFPKLLNRGWYVLCIESSDTKADLIPNRDFAWEACHSSWPAEL